MTPLETFATLAHEFCSWAEAPSSDAHSELRCAQRLLPRLYASALDLPHGVPADAERHVQGALTYDAAFRRFGALPINMYATCDPLVVPCEEPGVGDVADDLADIYADLHRGLAMYRAGDTDAAAWEWSFNFRAHWGDHAVGALAALQAFATRI